MNSILKEIDERINMVLKISLVLGVLILAAVIFPMANRVKELKRQEVLVSSNARLLTGLMKKDSTDQVGPMLISPNKVSEVIEELTALGSEHSVTFLSLIQQDKKKSNYKKMSVQPVELETRSSFKQLGSFLGRINGLSQGIILIDSFQVFADENDQDKVRSIIHMYILLKKEGNAKK